MQNNLIKNASQLNLNLFHDEQSLKAYFEKATGKGIVLTITENSSSMITVRMRGDSILLRLHRIFLSAGAHVLEEVTGMMKNKKGKTPHLNRFIKDNSKYIAKKPGRFKIVAEGKFHNLFEIYNSLNKEYFGNEVSAQITWGIRNHRRFVRRRILGSYLRDGKIIRINPVLDSKRVPGYYIEYVVYHEMLHADMDTEPCRCRRSIHSKEFRRREKLFRHYEKASAFEKM